MIHAGQMPGDVIPAGAAATSTGEIREVRGVAGGIRGLPPGVAAIRAPGRVRFTASSNVSGPRRPRRLRPPGPPGRSRPERGRAWLSPAPCVTAQGVTAEGVTAQGVTAEGVTAEGAAPADRAITAGGGILSGRAG